MFTSKSRPTAKPTNKQLVFENDINTSNDSNKHAGDSAKMLIDTMVLRADGEEAHPATGETTAYCSSARLCSFSNLQLIFGLTVLVQSLPFCLGRELLQQ